jgi:hypothetical protein
MIMILGWQTYFEQTAFPDDGHGMVIERFESEKNSITKKPKAVSKSR